MCCDHVMGFGEIPEKALTGPMQKMLDSGFIQAVKMVVDQDGLQRGPEGAGDPGGRGGVCSRSIPRWASSSPAKSQPEVPLGGPCRRRGWSCALP